MIKSVCALLWAAAFAGAAPVTISGPIRKPNLQPAVGEAIIRLTQPCLTAGGDLILDRPLPVKFNGTLTVALEPNSVCPNGALYEVRYLVNRVFIGPAEYWVVPPTPTTTTIAAVRRESARPPTFARADTKGDLGVFDGLQWQKLAKGADGQVLTVASTTDTGLQWSAGSVNAVTRASASAAANSVPRSVGASRELQDSLLQVDGAGNVSTPGILSAGSLTLGLEGECAAPGSVVAPTAAGSVVIFCDSTETGRLSTKNTAGQVQKYLRDGEATSGGGPVWSCVAAPTAQIMAGAVTAVGQVATGCTIPAGALVPGRLLRWEVLGSWDGAGGGFRWTLRAGGVDLTADLDAYVGDPVGAISARGIARPLASNQIFAAESRVFGLAGWAATALSMGYTLNSGVVTPLSIDLSAARPLAFNFSRIDAGGRLRFWLFRVWVETE